MTRSVFGDADHFFTAIGPNPTIFVCAAETFGLAHTTADGIFLSDDRLDRIFLRIEDSSPTAKRGTGRAIGRSNSVKKGVGRRSSSLRIRRNRRRPGQ